MMASDVEVPRLESQLSDISQLKPRRMSDEPHAKYYWRLIRTCVREAVDLVKKADIRDIIVGHGVHHGRRLNHAEPIKQMIYNKNTGEYLTLDSKMVRVFHTDGRKKDILTPEEPINRLLFASQVNLYIGWCYNTPQLLLFSLELDVLSTSECQVPVLTAAYNENINEVVTAGPGCITSWVFRYGGRHLLPRKVTTTGLCEKDMFSLLVLEDTASRSQKCFGACNTGVAVFNLYEGRVVSYEKNLHTRQITGMTFFNPLKYLITGAKDGTIKVWDEKWHLQLVFVGHLDAVMALAAFPYGPHIMSTSKDCTLRVWSLETCDEVDRVDTQDPVEFLGTQINQDNLCSFAASHADLWKVQHIHTLHTTIGHRVHKVKCTEHPSYPLRCVLMCSDSSARIISPMCGEVITTLLQHPKRHLVDAAYAVADDILFAVFGDGTIVKSNTSTNPCTTIDEWPCPDTAKACNYLLVYEYVISEDLTTDLWSGMQRAIATRSIATPRGTSQQRSSNRTLLLGGRRDGCICVFNWDTGAVEFEIEAHGSKGVLSMVANSKADQLISAGLDNIIKLWRLFPFAQESLAPLMSFYCGHKPAHMSIMKNSLAVAFQEPTTATYSVVLYNLVDKNRYDHEPGDDHTDSITALSCCPRMKLFASASMDGTIRIWNQANKIVRLLKLNTPPYSMAFCSPKGDLLVGVGNHVHMISYKNYMPKSYRFKMISMEFPAPQNEEPIPFNEEMLSHLHKEDVKRLKASRSSFKYTHFVDILTAEETEEVMREKKLREKAFALIDKRDEELMKIRDGHLEATRKPRPTPATKRAAFNKYLDIFYSRPKTQVPEEDPFEQDYRFLDKPEEKQDEEAKEEQREEELTGFFPPASQAVKQPTLAPSPVLPHITPREPTLPLPIKADGFIPNSVLVRLLWPQRTMTDMEQKTEERYRPPQLTEEQLKQAATSRKQSEKTPRRPSVLFLDYDEEEKQAEPSEGGDTARASKLSKESSSFMQRIKAMDKPATPQPSQDEEDSGAAEQPEAAEDDLAASPEEREKKKRSTKKREVKPSKPIMKYIAPRPPPPAKKVTPPPRPETPSRSPTPPPPPPTPLPVFITQFRGMEWFEQYFPNCNENTMPKPWSAAAFVAMLARVLRIAEYPHKIKVAEAILVIHEMEGIPNGDAVVKSALGVLHHHKTSPTCQDPTEKEFILVALRLLCKMGIYDREVVAEIMTQFIDGDRDVRNAVEEALGAMGLKDPHNYFTKEMDSWDTWNIEGPGRKDQLKNLCRDWLDKWMTTFKIHLEDSIDRLKKGEQVRGHLTQHDVSSLTDAGKSSSKEEAGEDGPLEGVQMVPASAKSKALTVTFQMPPDPSSIDGASHIEAVNYFCEMELQKQLELLRDGGRAKADGLQKNTVLVLPKLTGKGALVRLGETHTSKCRPHRETSLADLKLPPLGVRARWQEPGQLHSFPPCINLPLKQVIMNPFPCPLDEYTATYQEPILLTLKTSQKYFVHSRSYVPMEHA